MIGIVIFLFIIFYLVYFYKNVKKLPPGPLPLPVIGNLLSIDRKKVHLWIYEQKKIYGNIFTIYIPNPQVVFADNDSISESLQVYGDNFIGRNVDGIPDKCMHEMVNVGVIMSEGEEWKDQRRLSLQILRNFGMSKTIIQDKIHLVILDVWEYIDNIENKENVDIGKIMHLAIGNVINLILFGFMYNHTDNKKFYEFTNAVEELVKFNRKIEFQLLTIFPWISNIPILKHFVYKWITKPQHDLRKMTNQQIEKCKKDFNPDSEPPNFVHAVMKEIQSIDSKYNYLNSNHLEAMVMDFWIAGMETTTTTLKWLILLLMKYPEIQEKLHKEIDEAIGKDQLVLLNDKVKMPYVTAFIAEGQRYANIVPFVPSHKCTKDTIINNYLIPKDTLTQPFFWGANMDEKYFKDSFIFDPTRFLDDDGKKFKMKYEHLSFGMGKRVCVGKSLAEAELFLFFTSLVQKYKFTYINGLVDLTCDFGGVLLPRPYTCKIEKR
ncbi:Cytochrome P450 18a1 [Strongyloides ratti]|uniref:Cytochrome P450 18a1 n=1 Tax=Strongyloides ratti TaxID=34506 RepID=A0A090LQK7_STRRB|nr:Cytochrome P450 18a1 [Strongyloides ratti]CEF70466.1 Cytochrome P450 18a1 [Strongyloides ratti]